MGQNPTGTVGGNYLDFSGSREGRHARARLSASKRQAPSANGERGAHRSRISQSDPISSARTRPESFIPVIAIPYGVYAVWVPAIIYFRHQCCLSIGPKPSIFSISRRRREPRLLIFRRYFFRTGVKGKGYCRNARECSGGPTSSNAKASSAPYVADDGLVFISEWLISLLSRGRAVPSKGRYILEIFGAEMGILCPPSHQGVNAATLVQGRKR